MTHAMRRLLISAGAVVLLGLAAVGLIETGMAIAGTSGSAPAAPLGASTTGAMTAAAVDPALTSDLDALLAADQTAAAGPATTARSNAAAGVIRRIAIARHLVHGTVVVDVPKLGGLTTVQLDHGTISAVNGKSLSVAEAGSTSATVTLGDETRVRRNATKAAIADLKVGDEVFVLSKVESGGTTAYLVIVPRT